MGLVEILTKPEVIDFMKGHQHDDPFALALSTKHYPHLPLKEIAQQLTARQKANKKLPEWCANHVIFPPSISVEQASSEKTARYKSQIINSGFSMIDLTGGMGVDSFNLSKKFEQATYVEKSQDLVQIAQHNFGILGANNIKCVQADAVEYLSSLNEQPDFIFLDPARRDDAGRKVFLLEHCTPGVIDILNIVIQKKWRSKVLVKLSPIIDIHYLAKELPNISETHIVSDRNECKEVLCYLDFKSKPESPLIKTINLTSSESQTFEFKFDQPAGEVAYSAPKSFLYEPNASVMKSAGFRHLANLTGLSKLHPNTHLFTSDHLTNNFPGYAYQIEKIFTNKKDIKHELKGNKFNLKVRNYGAKPAEIVKLTGIKEGGDQFLFACTWAESQRGILKCSLVDQ